MKLLLHVRPTALARLLAVATRIGALVRDSGLRWADDACYRLGASLAYYALFSIFPLLLLSTTLVGFALGDDDTVRQKLLASISNASSPAFRTLLDQTLASMQSHRTARGVGAVVGVVTLLFGASGVFSELQSSLNLIWRVRSPPSRGLWSLVAKSVKDKAFAFAVVVAAAVALLASLAVSTALSAFGQTAEDALGHSTLWLALEMVVSIGVMVLLLAAVFRMVPQTKVRWRDVLGAAVATSFLLAALKRALAWYLAHVGSYAAYGAVGAVLGLLTWIYLASLLLFFGAEMSRVYAEKYGSLASRARPQSA